MTHPPSPQDATPVDPDGALCEDYGDFEAAPQACTDFLTLNFTLSDEHRLKRWSNYGLSADFLGDYFSAFFPGPSLDEASISRRDAVKAAVSFVANELIENAVKYGERSDALPITICLRLYGSTILFEASNPATADHVERYRAFVTRLLETDPAELYFQQLEQTATGTGQSHMGLLTMINDYQARFGWRFAPVTAPGSGVERWMVTVMVRLDLGDTDPLA